MIDLRSLKLDFKLQKMLNHEALNGDFTVFVYISMFFLIFISKLHIVITNLCNLKFSFFSDPC